jgi:ADP-ribose pyrophosphatase YjhB (NUDIX family)
VSHPPQGIKVKAFAVLLDADRTHQLVWRGHDRVEGSDFHRPLGGHVERGETTAAAVVREIAEETGSALLEPRLLGVLENIYVHEGEPGHEVVFVYAGDLADPDVVPPGGGWLQDDGEPIRVDWRPLATTSAGELPLHPDGLDDLLRTAGMLER